MPPLTESEKVKQIVARAVKEGCLMPEQLEEIENMLTAVRRLKDEHVFVFRQKRAGIVKGIMV